jgi:putative membrane protein
MVQHVLLGDLAPLAIVAGLTGPILRPLLSLRPVIALRVLAHPLVALPLWAIDLGLWHVPLLYEGALHHDALHALEHACFFASGALMWAAVIEVLPAPAWFGTGWKLGYILCVRAFETVLGNVFLWAGSVFYPFYEHPTERWGISALSDQGIAGGVMMIEGSLVTIGALAWLFLRLARESELRQQLIEAGTDPAAAARAVRYGRGEELRAGR